MPALPYWKLGELLASRAQPPLRLRRMQLASRAPQPGGFPAPTHAFLRIHSWNEIVNQNGPPSQYEIANRNGYSRCSASTKRIRPNQTVRLGAVAHPFRG